MPSLFSVLVCFLTQRGWRRWSLFNISRWSYYPFSLVKLSLRDVLPKILILPHPLKTVAGWISEGPLGIPVSSCHPPVGIIPKVHSSGSTSASHQVRITKCEWKNRQVIALGPVFFFLFDVSSSERNPQPQAQRRRIATSEESQRQSRGKGQRTKSSVIRTTGGSTNRPSKCSRHGYPAAISNRFN